MAFYLAGEITQVIDSIPWVRCASGNVYYYLLYRSIAEAHFQKSRAEAALGKIGDSESSIKAAIAVLEERAVNLSKMELSPHLVEEIADLEGLGIDLEEILVEFKEGVTEQTKRKLSAGSPSAKLAGVEKAPKIDDAKSISATTVGIA